MNGNMYTVQQGKEEIKSSIQVYLKKDENGNYRMKEVNRLPFYLVGKPGIGKTEMARQIAEELNIGFESLSITHHTRNTVLGLPLIRKISDAQETSYTEYTMSEMIALVEKKVEQGYPEGILLIDEFACMADSLVAPMLAFLQTKNIGTHKLPEGWVLILCSNPSKYNRSARSFDMAVMDRVRLMEIEFDPAEFLAYGEQNGLHEDILAFLKMFPKDTHVCNVSESGEKTIVTTRGWENLSWCLQGYEEADLMVSSSLVRQFIKSDDISDRFYQFYLSNRAGLKVKEIAEILDGKNLTGYIDRMAEKSYAQRFQMMRLLGEALVGKGGNINETTDFLEYLEMLPKDLDKKDESFRTLIKRRLDGEQIVGSYLQRPLDDREREMWEGILKTLQNEGADIRKNEEWKEKAMKAMAEFRKQEAKKLRTKQTQISEMIGNACMFLAAVEGKECLTDAFINSINQSKDILGVMTAVKNPVYLKYCRKAYGTDDFLKRTVEQVS